MPWCIWNRTTQDFQNRALHFSEEEANDYIARLDAAHTVQSGDVPEFVAVELPSAHWLKPVRNGSMPAKIAAGEPIPRARFAS